MIGKVWEWAPDSWSPRHRAAPRCCAIGNLCATGPSSSFDPSQPCIRVSRRVPKGGSYVGAPNYCRRYGPAPRHPEMEDSATTNGGFRRIFRV